MIRSFDIVEMVISVASKQFADKYKQDSKLTFSLKEVCDTIDVFAEPGGTKGCNESYGVDVDVDIKTQEIIIGLDFDMCEFRKDDPMCKIMEQANDIVIKMSDENEGAIRLEMRFPGVWIPK